MLSLTCVTALNAQGPSLSRALREIPPARHDVTTGEGLTATVGIAALFLVDRPVRVFLQSHRSSTLDRYAGAASRPAPHGPASTTTSTGPAT